VKTGAAVGKRGTFSELLVALTVGDLEQALLQFRSFVSARDDFLGNLQKSFVEAVAKEVFKEEAIKLELTVGFVHSEGFELEALQKRVSQENSAKLQHLVKTEKVLEKVVAKADLEGALRKLVHHKVKDVFVGYNLSGFIGKAVKKVFVENAITDAAELDSPKSEKKTGGKKTGGNPEGPSDYAKRTKGAFHAQEGDAPVQDDDEDPLLGFFSEDG
jgi:hypothetical protein